MQNRSRQSLPAAHPKPHSRAARPGQVHPVLKLQQTVGNRAAAQLVESRQANAVPILPPAHPLERAAQSSAAEAMRPPAADAPPPRPRPPLHPPPNPAASALLRTPGAPLDPSARAFFDSRFQSDFSAVRIHADSEADVAARSLGAAAFTAGADIAFARGLFDPHSSRGRTLLAHELAHVAQQASGPPMLARQTTEEYETRSIQLTRDSLDKAAQQSYWDLKFQDYGVRLHADSHRVGNSEEANAVLSVAWQMRPQPLTQEVTNTVIIPSRPGGKGTVSLGSTDLAYRLTFRPPVAPQTRGDLILEFMAEGSAAHAVQPDAPSTRFVPKQIGFDNAATFPGKDPARYWQTHGEEYRRVYHWIEDSAGNKFNQILTIGSGNQSTSFLVFGDKDQSTGQVASAGVAYLGSVSTQHAPADYASRGFGDKFIEDLRTVPDPIHNDLLGAIPGLQSVPREALSSVQYAITQYFRSQGAKPGKRDAEVDVIAPVVDPPAAFRTRANSGRRAFFTLRFNPAANGKVDVDVQWIGFDGEHGIGLTAQGNLARVNGFSDHAQGATEADKVQALTAWLDKRYPGVADHSSATVADIERDVTAKIRARSGTPDWYRDIYGIEVINDPTKASDRLLKAGVPRGREHEGLKPFPAVELAVLEVALEKMSDAVVKRFRGVAFTRQAAFIKYIPGSHPPDFETKTDTAGITSGSQRNETITIFDQAFVNENNLFLGGAPQGQTQDLEVASAQVFAHELGHVVSYLGGRRAGLYGPAKEKFDKLVSQKVIPPITWYAASDPGKEFFAEAFGLFYRDPAWLKANRPDLFTFFADVDKNGP